jgi:teichuronic acid biosynthesis glycosyltransferase TuaC
VLPSVDEAFGVAYIEAMAGGVPAVGLAGEAGPEEIARTGGGMLLTTRERLAADIAQAVARREELGAAARRTVLDHFTWDRCGRDTVAGYEDALR